MPNRQKRTVFCVAGALGFVCVLTVAVSLGLPRWLHGTVLCHTGAQLVNASGAELDKFLGRLSYGLFQGERVKQCGLGGRPLRFYCESIVNMLLIWLLPVSNHGLNSESLVITCSHQVIGGDDMIKDTWSILLLFRCLAVQRQIQNKGAGKG